MKKVGIASDLDNVSEHFGHCESFTVYEIDNNKVLNKTIVENPGHKPGFLPNFLNDLCINVIISGGMGAGAIDIFKEKGIEIIVGISGTLENTIEKYISGSLQSSDSVCEKHEHHDSCGNH